MINNEPWVHQKELLKKPVPTIYQLADLIANSGDIRDKGFFSLVYLTGGRVTECINVQKDDLKKEIINGIPVLNITMINLKNRRVHIKELPVRTDREENKPFIKNVLAWKDMCRTRLLFQFTRQNAHYLLTKKLGFNPHYLRHARCTHIIKMYNLSDQQLKAWFGWTDTRPAKHYSHLRTGDLVEKM